MSGRSLFIALAILAAASPGDALMQGGEPEAPGPQQPEGSFAPPTWEPADSAPQKWEWVKLTSGEWLKGELTVMRRDVLEFDSDQLDDLEIDWEDVALFRSPRINTFAFTDRRMATGVGMIDEEKVVVITALGEETFPRSELLSIVSGGMSEVDHWSGKASFGLTARAGNTQQMDAIIQGELRRRTPFTRLSLDYRGNFGTVNREQTINNNLFDARFDLFLFDRFFVTPATLEYFTDEFQNIEGRISAGPGVGYTLVDHRRLDWEVGADALYRQTNFPPSFGASNVERDGTLRLSTVWESEITSRIDFDGSYTVTIGIPDPGNTNQSAQLVLSVEATSLIDVDVSFYWDRIGQPRESNGVVPLQDDFKLSIGASIEF